jgi:hypothetical protein
MYHNVDVAGCEMNKNEWRVERRNKVTVNRHEKINTWRTTGGNKDKEQSHRKQSVSKTVVFDGYPNRQQLYFSLNVGLRCHGNATKRSFCIAGARMSLSTIQGILFFLERTTEKQQCVLIIFFHNNVAAKQQEICTSQF